MFALPRFQFLSITTRYARPGHPFQLHETPKYRISLEKQNCNIYITQVNVILYVPSSKNTLNYWTFISFSAACWRINYLKGFPFATNWICVKSIQNKYVKQRSRLLYINCVSYSNSICFLQASAPNLKLISVIE